MHGPEPTQIHHPLAIDSPSTACSPSEIIKDASIYPGTDLLKKLHTVKSWGCAWRQDGKAPLNTENSCMTSNIWTIGGGGTLRGAMRDPKPLASSPYLPGTGSTRQGLVEDGFVSCHAAAGDGVAGDLADFVVAELLEDGFGAAATLGFQPLGFG